ncbi:MAG: LysR family transcriptional regulator [Burkholderiales bacterium]|nr:LysR family transcriptional regulator [Burkholderiales bacterium]MCW5604327.1 LysR family transcriptional regulator [Burkholderiales bacterium]
MPRYPGLTLRILGEDGPAIGPGKARLIELIDSEGSISAAARAMEMSYRRAWQLVDAMNASFREPVVITAIGGKSGGGAQVTEFGRLMALRFREMESRASAVIGKDIERFAEHLRRPRGRSGS